MANACDPFTAHLVMRRSVVLSMVALTNVLRWLNMVFHCTTEWTTTETLPFVALEHGSFAGTSGLDANK